MNKQKKRKSPRTPEEIKIRWDGIVKKLCAKAESANRITAKDLNITITRQP